MTWADGLLLIIGLPVLGAAFYLGVLTLLSGRVAAPAPGRSTGTWIAPNAAARAASSTAGHGSPR